MLEELGKDHQYNVTLSNPPAPWGNSLETANKAPFSGDLDGTWTPAESCQEVQYPGHEKTEEKERPRNAPGTRLIPTSRGLFVTVDDVDFERLSRHKWCLTNGYPSRRFQGKLQYLHRFLMNPPEGVLVDHINGDKLDARRSNLRLVTDRENAWNHGKYYRNGKATSRYMGVSFDKNRNLWAAAIAVDGKKKFLGYSRSEITAAFAFDREARLRFGAFARTNFPPPPAIIYGGQP